MHDLKERIAYIKGLSAGMNVDPTTAEGRILTEVIEVLEDVVRSIGKNLETDAAGAPEEDDGIECLGVKCPKCRETVFVDADVFDGDEAAEVLCPECHGAILLNDGIPAEA